VANTLYLQEVKRLTALLRATSADSGDGGGGSDRRSPKRPQSVFGRSSLDQSKLSMQNVYEVRYPAFPSSGWFRMPTACANHLNASMS
jgi:hypothetical protein